MERTKMWRAVRVFQQRAGDEHYNDITDVVLIKENYQRVFTVFRSPTRIHFEITARGREVIYSNGELIEYTEDGKNGDTIWR